MLLSRRDDETPLERLDFFSATRYCANVQVVDIKPLSMLVEGGISFTECRPRRSCGAREGVQPSGQVARAPCNPVASDLDRCWERPISGLSINGCFRKCGSPHNFLER